MKATVVDLRRNPKRILEAIARNETVTLTYRGKPVARIAPIAEEPAAAPADITEHPTFGMWAGRDDLEDPAATVRAMRRGRTHGL